MPSYKYHFYTGKRIINIKAALVVALRKVQRSVRRSFCYQEAWQEKGQTHTDI